MARVVIPHLRCNPRYRQISCDEQRLRFANPAAQNILQRRISGHFLADMRQIVRTDVQRIRHLLQRKFVRKMLVDVILDALCKGIAAVRAALGCGRAELLHKRQDRKQKMMCTVVVALGQLIVKHVVQMLQPHGLRLDQAAHRTRILRDQRIFAQSGHSQSAKRQTRGCHRTIRSGRLIVHDAAVEDEQIAAACLIRRAADKIAALAASHEYNFH